jgi:hypothetical protein
MATRFRLNGIPRDVVRWRGLPIRAKDRWATLQFTVLRLAIAALALLAMSQELVASECSNAPRIAYRLGPKVDVDKLYPVIKTAYMSEYDYSMAVATSIEFYLRNSLARDQIGYCSLSVTPAGDAGYDVSFHSSNPKADSYGKTQISWLENSRLGLKGVQDCQNDRSCWEPTGQDLACSGPWQFYLPLGLPMVSQKMVMLLHYPPYVAMQQSDYLNNATLNRWQRLLVTVGVATKDWTLFATIVDIFPIAAPGSGESGCFPPPSARKFFGDRGSGYIPAMLNALVAPTTPNTHNTIPVIIFGAEARGYWKDNYPDAPAGVLDAGSVSLDGKLPERRTPYMGANHPIGAVYQKCPKLETIVKEDLTTACFAKAMATTPDADPIAIAAACKESYFSAAPSVESASQICITAVIDKSPQFESWTTSQARNWCDSHNNRPCPLPNY